MTQWQITLTDNVKAFEEIKADTLNIKLHSCIAIMELLYIRQCFAPI